MGIQINGQTDTISATDGSLTIDGVTLSGTPDITVGAITATSFSGTNLNATGIVTATSFSGSGSALTGVGKILQVVSTSSSENTTNSTSTYATLLSQTITLSSTSNYVLAFASISLRVNQNTNAYGDVAIYHTDTSGTQVVQVINGQNENVSSDYNFNCFGRHAPSSTDEQTYVLAFRRGSSATTSVSTDSRKYELILMEVAA